MNGLYGRKSLEAERKARFEVISQMAEERGLEPESE